MNKKIIAVIIIVVALYFFGPHLVDVITTWVSSLVSDFFNNLFNTYIH